MQKIKCRDKICIYRFERSNIFIPFPLVMAKWWKS